MTDEREVQHQDPPEDLRLPYTPPRLVVHGTLAEITRIVGRTSNKDGGTGQKARSQP